MSIRLLIALALSAAPALAAPQIALTFDDLPAHAALPPGMTRVDVAKQTITALQAAKVPSPYGLVNGALLQAEPAAAPVLKLWRAAGFPLGNHTWSHMELARHTAEEYEAEIVRNEPILSANAAGSDWRWFRYPYLSEGDTPDKRSAVRAFLASRGYKLATVTMMFGDWLYSEPYARCAASNDGAAVAEMEKDYFNAAEQGVTYYRALSNSAFGRDIPYVLLLHIGAFEARTLPKLLDLYRAHGFEFVSLEQAMRDPYYAGFVDPAQPAPPANLEGRLDAARLAAVAKPADYAPALDRMCR